MFNKMKSRLTGDKKVIIRYIIYTAEWLYWLFVVCPTYYVGGYIHGRCTNVVIIHALHTANPLHMNIGSHVTDAYLANIYYYHCIYEYHISYVLV